MTVRRVLMVCMGNICRSPTAEAVLRHKLEATGLGSRVSVDSAGTHAEWHDGEAPDHRAQAHAARRGYDLSALRARRLVESDFEIFDLILAMDEDNLAELRDRCPTVVHHKLGRLTAHCRLRVADAVPDPYYGGAAGFEEVLDLVEDACDGLVQMLQRENS
ncbi:MAG: low molecular weight phosphotyrosine protein phosphatase [Piscinibacter sp.]|nr:low molecular weight phosphotyrosine protein phosphatase [Piscinibacter sp.]